MIERYVIHVTKACNMACLYCYEKDKTSTYKIEEIIQLCKNILKYSNGKEFGIEFLGGEPMLAWEYIKDIYSFFELKAPDQVRDYVITTNGTILTDEQLAFLKANPKIIYAVSLDGHKWSNQMRLYKNGKNSYDDVVENLERARAVLDSENIFVHMVTHHYNVAFLSDSIKHLYKLGIKNIGIGTVESTMVIDIHYCDRFVTECNKVMDWMFKEKIKDLYIDIFEGLKPKNDVRTYIKDDAGKVIGETYGRNTSDITAENVYNSIQTTSEVADMIYCLRECVYNNYQVRKNEA